MTLPSGRDRRSLIAVVLIAFFFAASCRESIVETTVPRQIQSKRALGSGTARLNLRSFGATGNGVADDGPALQRALDALATSGGGTLVVPPGLYAIVTPVSKDFPPFVSVEITGEESGTPLDLRPNGAGLNLTSELIIKVGSSQAALSLRSLDRLSLKDVAFVGVPDVRDDAHVVLRVHAIKSVSVQHCEFYGLASLTEGGSIIAASESGLKVDQTSFLGCSTNAAHMAPLIQNLMWKNIQITNTKFIDYGTRPDFFSKTPMAPPYSWINIGNAMMPGSRSLGREAVVRNVLLDEGALVGIAARPDLYSPASVSFDVFISDVRMNVTNLVGWGLYLKNANRVFVERSHFGWSRHADAAITLFNVKEAILDRVECVLHANTIRADASTERLTIIDSVYDKLDSAAPDTKVIKTTDPMKDPVQYVRNEYRLAGAEPELRTLYRWANAMLRCEDTPCLVAQQKALSESLKRVETRSSPGS